MTDIKKIQEFMSGRESFLMEDMRKLQTLKTDIEQLSNDPKVKKYLSTVEELADQERKISVQKRKYEKMAQKNCDHPMYVMVKVYDDYYKISSNDVYCVLCGSEMELPDVERSQCLASLYSKKRLIANYIGVVQRTQLPKFDSFSSMIFSDAFIVPNPIERIREAYFRKGLEVVQQIEDGQLPDDFSVNDYFFDSICESGYERYLCDFPQKEDLSQLDMAEEPKQLTFSNKVRNFIHNKQS